MFAVFQHKSCAMYGCGFKKLGLGQTPHPLVGTKSDFFKVPRTL